MSIGTPRKKIKAPTIDDLIARIEILERELADLKSHSVPLPDPRRPWWREGAGRFAGDEEFQEIVRLGRKYRESLRPKKKRKTSR